MPQTIAPSAPQPARPSRPLTDPEIVAYLNDLMRRGAGVSMAINFNLVGVRAAWASVGRGSYLVGEGRTLGEALADVQADERSVRALGNRGG